MTATDFAYICTLVRNEAAIVLEPGKEYLVESRMQSLARREKLPSVDQLFKMLQTGPKNGLHRKAVDAMTTNETSFFRDLHPFEALRKVILPEIIQRRAASRQLNIWCGAASTGQEPFSVMMLLAEHFPDVLNWNLTFIATDLSADVLAKARAGCFSQLEINRGLPAALLLKHFIKHDGHWEFNARLRNRIQFRELNLSREFQPMPAMDIVFLRNVLIYFDTDAKRKILARVRKTLQPGGYLLLGGSETTINIDESFERVICDRTACFRTQR